MDDGAHGRTPATHAADGHDDDRAATGFVTDDGAGPARLAVILGRRRRGVTARRPPWSCSVTGRSSPGRARRWSVVKIVVIGGTGRVGSRLVARLGERGHQAVAASPDTGVNTISGD